MSALRQIQSRIEEIEALRELGLWSCFDKKEQDILKNELKRRTRAGEKMPARVIIEGFSQTRVG